MEDSDERVPSGLSGAEIGLYYRSLALKRNGGSVEGGEKKIKVGASVCVPPDVLAQVMGCLERFDASNQDNNVSDDFKLQFHHLRDVQFDEFLEFKRQKFLALKATKKSRSALSVRLLSEFETKNRDDVEWIERLQKRNQLPTMQQANDILRAVKENQVLLVVGSTGCGKTTQVPQLILDEAIAAGRGAQMRIACTQPRRISAISVAERVAYERCERLGTSIGYQIRLDNVMPRDFASILYCTTGILLQKMQSDPLMSDLGVIILDEIHERTVETDLLMGLLKKILPLRPDLKVVLMSATVSEKDFQEYFDNCCTLTVAGTLFPVTVHYLEDILQETGYTKFDEPSLINGRRGNWRHSQQNMESVCEYRDMIGKYLRQIRHQYSSQVLQALRCPDSEGCNNLRFIEYLIYYICTKKPEGAILVFLPGWDKITKLHSMLQSPTHQLGHHVRDMIEVHPLHSMIPTSSQQRVFQPPAPNKRKVILSTILAETSVTIDDVVYVIDTGRTKDTSYNVETKIQMLDECWVTKANSQQRKGRAGRVQPGICYNLFTKAREQEMKDIPTPEILRCRLESIILNMKLLHIKDVYGFLKTLISVPHVKVIKHGVQLLTRLEALDTSEDLTPLGMHLARLPIDPQMAKMLLMSALFRCVDPITSVAAGLSYKSAFYIPMGQEKRVDAVKLKLAANTRSDHLLIDNVILSYREAVENADVRQFCYENFLNIATLKQLEDMKYQFANLLQNASFLDSSDCSAYSSNVNSSNLPLLRAVIAAGLYPNIARLSRVHQVRKRTHAIHHMETPEDGRINFHPSTVNSGVNSFNSYYFVYLEKQKSSSLYMLDSTMVFPMALLIFGDMVETGVNSDGIFYISVGNSLYFKCDIETANVIKNLRERLQWLLQKKALYPSPIGANSSETHVITAIQILLSLDEAHTGNGQGSHSD